VERPFWNLGSKRKIFTFWKGGSVESRLWLDIRIRALPWRESKQGRPKSAMASCLRWPKWGHARMTQAVLPKCPLMSKTKTIIPHEGRHQPKNVGNATSVPKRTCGNKKEPWGRRENCIYEWVTWKGTRECRCAETSEQTRMTNLCPKEEVSGTKDFFLIHRRRKYRRRCCFSGLRCGVGYSLAVTWTLAPP
jgi:hypothetical protein